MKDLYDSMPHRNMTYKAASQPEKPANNLSIKLSQANNNPSLGGTISYIKHRNDVSHTRRAPSGLVNPVKIAGGDTQDVAFSQMYKRVGRKNKYD